MWLWLRNQITRRNAQGRRRPASRQSSLPKVKMLLQVLEDRAVPTVSNQATGAIFTGTDAIQRAINNALSNGHTGSETLLVDPQDVAGYYDGFTVPNLFAGGGGAPGGPANPDGDTSITIVATTTGQANLPIIRATQAGNTSSSNPAGAQAGIGIQVNSDNVTIDGLDVQPNISPSFTGNLIGIVVGGSNNVVIQHGRVQGYVVAGVQFQTNIVNAVLRLNDIFNNSGPGVRFFGTSRGAQVVGNVVRNNQGAGFFFTSGFQDPLNTGPGSGNTPSNVFALNSISGNAGGGVVNQTNVTTAVNSGTTTITPDQPVNFSFNYWGSANGPSVNGIQAGDSVTANNVDISPFLTTPDADLSTPGYQAGNILGMRVSRRALTSGAVYNHFGVNGNFGYISTPGVERPSLSQVSGNFIQEAVDFVGGVNGRANTTVDVDPGLYTEVVRVEALGLVSTPLGAAAFNYYPTGLTLQGLNNANVNPTSFANPFAPNPARGPETTIQNPGGGALAANGGALIQVAADGVSIKGFTLEGSTGGSSPTFATHAVLARDTGTNGAGATTFTLSNLLVQNNLIGDLTGTGVTVVGTNPNQVVGAGTDPNGFVRASEPQLSVGNTVSQNLIRNVPTGVNYVTNAYGTISGNFMNNGAANGQRLDLGVNVGTGGIVGAPAAAGNAYTIGTSPGPNSSTITGSLLISGNRIDVNATGGGATTGGIRLDNGNANNNRSTAPAGFGDLTAASFTVDGNTVNATTGNAITFTGIAVRNGIQGAISVSNNTVSDAADTSGITNQIITGIELGNLYNSTVTVTGVAGAPAAATTWNANTATSVALSNNQLNGVQFGIVAGGGLPNLSITGGQIQSTASGTTQFGVLILNSETGPGSPLPAASAGVTNAVVTGGVLPTTTLFDVSPQTVGSLGTSAIPGTVATLIGLSVSGTALPNGVAAPAVGGAADSVRVQDTGTVAPGTASPGVVANIFGGTFSGNSGNGIDVIGVGQPVANTTQPFVTGTGAGLTGITGASASIQNATIALTGAGANQSVGLNDIQGAFVTLASSIISMPAGLTPGQNNNSARSVNVNDSTLILNASNTFGGGVDGIVAADTGTGGAQSQITRMSVTSANTSLGANFNGQTRNFVDVGVGVQPLNPDLTTRSDLDFTGYQFTAPGLTPGDPFGIEDRITHYLDDPTAGGTAVGNPALGIPTGTSGTYDPVTNVMRIGGTAGQGRPIVRYNINNSNGLYVTQTQATSANANNGPPTGTNPLAGLNVIQNAVNAAVVDGNVNNVNVQGGAVDYKGNVIVNPYAALYGSNPSVPITTNVNQTTVGNGLSLRGAFATGLTSGTNPLSSGRSAGPTGASESRVVAPATSTTFAGIGTFNAGIVVNAEAVTVNGFSILGSTANSGANASSAGVLETAAFGTRGATTGGSGINTTIPGTRIVNNFFSNFVGTTGGGGAPADAIRMANGSAAFDINGNDIGTSRVGILVAGSSTNANQGNGTNNQIRNNRIHDLTIVGTPNTDVNHPANVDGSAIAFGTLGGTNNGGGVLTIRNNEVNVARNGVVVGSSGTLLSPNNAVVTLNAFRGVTNRDVINPSPIVLNASTNWWGSNDQSAVAATVGANASPGNNVDFSPWLDNGTDTDTTTAFNPISATTPLVLDVVPEVGSLAPVVSPQVDSTTAPNNPIQEAYNVIQANGVTAGGVIQIEQGTYNRLIDLTKNTLTNTNQTLPVTLDIANPGPGSQAALDTPGTLTINGNVTLSPSTTLRLTVNGSGASDVININGLLNINGAKMTGIVLNPPSGPLTVINVSNNSNTPPTGNFTVSPTFTYRGNPIQVTPTVATTPTGGVVQLTAAISTVFVDDNFTLVQDADNSGGLSNGDVVSAPENVPGSQNLIFGFNAFNTIQSGLNALAAGTSATPATVNVIDGTYNESVSLNKAFTTLQALVSATGNVNIVPPSGNGITITAANDTVNGAAGSRNAMNISGGAGTGRVGVDVAAGGTQATIQSVNISGFTDGGSAGVRLGLPGTSAKVLFDNISNNAMGVLVSGGSALVQGTVLANNNTQGSGSAGILAQAGARVDAGGGDGAGLGGSSGGGNIFTGYAQGAAQAIVNLNSVQTTPSATAPVSTTTGNVAAQNNTWTGASNYADVEKMVFHKLDSPFSAWVDYRGALGSTGALAAPTVVAGSFRYVASSTDRNDPLSANQRSMIQGISFQFDGPVALNSGATLAQLLTVLRESPTSTPGYPAGSLPANNTALAASAIDLANSSILQNVTDSSGTPSGRTTVTIRFLNTGAYAGGGSAVMTEFGSLIDGIYSAVVNGANASLLFGGSGTAVTSGTAQRFHRLFGDVDNSGELDAADFSALRNYLASPSSPFRPYMDFNANGNNQDDTAAFNARLGSSLISP